MPERHSHAQSARSFLHGFARREDGSLLYFSLVLFVLMLMIGGLAVDLMRFETSRTRMQQTLDRATLAAASLTQELTPEDVVHDYFEKAELDDYLRSVVVTEGLNFRNVNAVATARTRNYFMHMVGIDELAANTGSTAEQRVTNVEIALVLDISGSMSGTKIANLKTAAKEFVDTIISSDPEDRISISLVPYNGQVNLGPVLRAKYNATHDHGVADVNCIDLPASVYTSVGMSRTLAMPMTGHVDSFSSTDKSTSFVSHTSTDYAKPNPANRWCPPSTTNTVTLPSHSIDDLQGRIQNLSAVGATSINAGLKWGLALLDPGARAMYSELIASHQIPAIFENRPFDYTDLQSMKVVVLMTDGEHFDEERLGDTYRTGLSTIYRSSGDGNYSIYHSGKSGGSKYWVPHLGTWRTAAWNSGAGVAQQTWPQVWGNLRVSWVAWQLYARALGSNNSTRSTQYNTWMQNFRIQTDAADMNTQLQQACALAKTNAIIIYGIAFEAPSGGQTQIRNCVSSPAHYFNASGLEIQAAFRAIASNISLLRLTQ